MSYKRALEAINLEFTNCIPNFEHIANPKFEAKLTGIDPYQHPQKSRLKALKLLDVDMITRLPLTDKPLEAEFDKVESSRIDEKGKKKVRWDAGGSWDWRHGYIFSSIEQILHFSPFTYFLKSEQEELFEDIMHLQRHLHLPIEEMARKLNDHQKKMQQLAGRSTLIPGHLYRTLLMWPLMLFGHQRFAELAYLHQRKFKMIWDEFAQISLKIMKAYALTGIKAMISHDDICITRGPLFNPEWYRKNLYPYYEEIWAPLKERDIKIIFVSDGNLDEVLDDIFSAGADGVLFEPYTDLEKLSKKHKNKILIGNIDSRVLLFGDRQDIRTEVKRCTNFGKDCPGFFYSVSNVITWNIPIENILYYFECCRKLGRR